jgi:hypothetical protein
MGGENPRDMTNDRAAIFSCAETKRRSKIVPNFVPTLHQKR